MKYIITVATKDEKIALIPTTYWHHVVITGIGMYNTLQALKDEQPDLIINIGFAGAKGLQVGTVCQVADCQPYQEHDIPQGAFHLTDEGYTCFTATDFIDNTTQTGPFLVDMELLAHSVCNCPVISYKVVSDNLDYDEYDKTLKSDYTNEIDKLLKEVVIDE